MGAERKQDDGRDWLVEQRYRAVLEVLDGSPVSEVAVRSGVSGSCSPSAAFQYVTTFRISSRQKARSWSGGSWMRGRL